MADTGTAVATFPIVTVAAAGTRVSLKTIAAEVAPNGAKAVTIQALTTNTGKIVVGDKEVVAAVGTHAAPTQRGVALNAGDTITLDIDDMALMWIDATATGDGISGLALLP
jgi:hypothetical protein